ncbi:UNVERIFIED_CONTAM: hypothetical protein Slati_0884800 [Sesamum latifolium]|uniref:Uncharacterized protein n=1 Tax=Sesamum latifolium TaxID=2727402 RepID=A0AAW2XT36_9LAMI
MEGAWCWHTSVEIITIIYGGEVRIVWTAPGAGLHYCWALSRYFGIASSFGWPFLGSCPPWISLGFVTWALTVCYARLPPRSPMITFSLGARLLRPVSMRSGGWFLFSGHILVGRHPSCGPRRDGKGNM